MLQDAFLSVSPVKSPGFPVESPEIHVSWCSDCNLLYNQDAGWWFSTSWQFHHPNWRTHIFQTGRLNHQPIMTIYHEIPWNPIKPSFSHGFPMVFPWCSHDSTVIPRRPRPLDTPALRADGQHPILQAQLMPPARGHHHHLPSTSGLQLLLVVNSGYIYIYI